MEGLCRPVGMICRIVVCKKDHGMKPMRWQKILIVTIFVLVFVVVLATNERPVSYSDFLSRDQQEIAVIADACDKFLRVTPRDATMIRVLSGNDKSLPPILRELRATQVEVASGFREGTNTLSRMLMTIGKPKDQFTVAWENNAKDNSLWELVVTGAEEQRIVVLSLRKNSAPTEGRR
jgi:hypothetical protein